MQNAELGEAQHRFTQFCILNSAFIINYYLCSLKINVTSKMDVPKDDDVNSQFTFTYDDIKGTVHVVDHLTGEEYDLLKEDTGWFDAEFKFDV